MRKKYLFENKLIKIIKETNNGAQPVNEGRNGEETGNIVNWLSLLRENTEETIKLLKVKKYIEYYHNFCSLAVIINTVGILYCVTV